jgi:aldehyde dehydrogenase (NAD+)
MLKFASLMDENVTVLAELTRITLGAPISTFNNWETAQASEAFKYYAGWIDKLAGESFPQEDGFMKITRHEPLGVTAGIVPWNGPLGTIGLKAGPALAARNCFILKPSEKTPFSSAALGAFYPTSGVSRSLSNSPWQRLNRSTFGSTHEGSKSLVHRINRNREAYIKGCC